MAFPPCSIRTRRAWLAALVVSALVGCTGGSSGTNSAPELVYGRLGMSEGRFVKPRAIAIDQADRIYICDTTARIQVFDTAGNYLRGWQTPVWKNGRPTGLGVDREGRVLVPDTHYYRVLIYSNQGDLLQTIGGVQGSGPGEFGWVTDCEEDAEGNLYVSEYGEWDRVQKFSRDGKFIRQWGGHGTEPGQFMRPQNIEIDRQGRVWIADACNHRLQIFDRDGALLEIRGKEGSGPGELSYPYDICFDEHDNVYVCEYGNHRVQKFSSDGKSLATWGSAGREPGQLWNPWGLVRDSAGRMHVLDSNNHRVQRVRI